MISRAYFPEKFQELSRKGNFHWYITEAGLPKVGFAPHDSCDQLAALEGEMFVENDLGGRLERLTTAAQTMRLADADPRAGNPGADRDPRPGHVEVSGERNEHWDGAVGSSSGGQFSGSLKFRPRAEPSSPLARAFGLDEVTEMKTVVAHHQFPGYHCEEVELLANTSEEIRLKVVAGGSEAPRAESYTLRLGPGGLLFVEENGGQAS